MSDQPTEGSWYDRNRERISEERREKYHSDPDHREKLLAQKRERRRKRRAEIAPFVEKKHNGKTYLLLRIGDAAERAGITIATIRHWEREGEIPEPSFPWKHRYYTEAQVELLKHFEASKKDNRSKASKKVHADWNKSV